MSIEKKEQDMRKRIENSFARQTMMQTFGARLREIAQGRVVITAPILPIATQQQGHGHAALSFAIGDTAAGYAALTALEPGMEVVTAEIKINLLAPARGDLLIATGRLEKAGRRLCVVTARVQARDGAGLRDVALLQGTMAPVPA
ncbi:PaaI family thioesterase [Pseudooceanicola aestuarii]|uniref:PaaI family thioesterase n=1 Tax=Pseudooceanicola aestuarii TaxID=2697319 RepID=UPI001EF7C454|nr:PaaI family thioesterase [Pseudooceanicola aestuarii]